MFYFIVTLILILGFQFNVNANTCPNTEMERLKFLADKVEITYDYEWKIGRHKENNGEYYYPTFTLTAANLDKDLKVIIEKDYLSRDYIEFKDNGNGTGILDGFSGGENINVTIRAYTDNDCSGKIVTNKKIKLPYLNLYSFEDACVEYTDFKYCDHFTEEKVSSEKFYAELDKYLKKKNEAEVLLNSRQNGNATSSFQVIKIVSISVIVILIVAVVIITINKKKKGRLK